ncbi:carboxyl transferase domain-containing protein [Tepidicaulis sp. LMO-SS28]|uniref:acetyl-CoA carboxylase family protein n=1 Tax=Tepidicaulis sp. LMO-SS28 TaxID=3447455 RepID=UPI003EE2B2F2
MKSLLIANRGEIAVRIARAAAEMGIHSVAVYAEDDAEALHVRVADEAVPLSGQGAAAYLDIKQIVAEAKQTGCDAIHPGYGFLSENAAFAEACAKEGIIFVGPSPEALRLFGDKAAARKLAEKEGVPLFPGTNGETSLADATKFMESLNGAPVMLKALAGGGGRGMRAVTDIKDLPAAYERCQSEAKAAFGSEAVYVEKLVTRARHIEIQIVGDGKDVIDLGERDCTLQRRNQKIVEIAPSPNLDDGLRAKLCDAARKLAAAAQYKGLGTFEFLVDEESGAFAFMEANPRLQVEHTVTEEVTGIDLVKTQLRILSGASLKEVGLGKPVPPRGFAVQLRINMERMNEKGEAVPTGGLLKAFTPPSGPGIRVDTFGYAGYKTSPNYDSLLAKLIAYSPSPDYGEAVARARRALAEFQIEGVDTNIPFLQALTARNEVKENRVYTTFIADHAAELVKAEAERPRYFTGGKTEAAAHHVSHVEAPEGTEPVPSTMQGKVISVDVKEGESIAKGQQIAVLEAMKMEHTINAPFAGVVRKIAAIANATLMEGDPLLFIEEGAGEAAAEIVEEEVDLDYIRPDLAHVIERHAIGLDENRPEAVARRRKRNQRTVRENIAHLCDEGSFIEYGALALAAQRRRRTMEELLKMSPADGLVSGIGTVNGDLFGEEKARAMVMGYDFTVFAGTQGAMNHKKMDRMLFLAREQKLPLVMLAEGGGGRPGDTDTAGVAGLDVPTFHTFATLSGKVPLVGMTAGRCFAGNAALLGCCDVIIATEDSNIGMGGPAMIEGGGLGAYAPEDIGPYDVQRNNGVIDVAVKDEEEAIDACKKYLSYFQGPVADWEADDQRKLRHVIPENRLRAYDIYKVIEGIVDKGSMLELRKDFGIGIKTALIRIEGRPMGLMANNPYHLGGAIDAPAADKAARFMQLCDAFGLPILSLCDTPGFMVGPDVEKDAQVRHVSRMFVTAANMKVPLFAVVLRKGYGLGAQSMTGGSFHSPFFNISWPTGEFGGMGLEGAVRLGYRREMEAIEDPDEREAFFQERVARSYENGKATNMAAFLEIDGVIDPAETRHWIMRGMKSLPPQEPGLKGRSFIDTW